MRWRQPGGGGIGGGTLSTAGNLVFHTLNDGRFLAYSADKSEKLLEIQTGLGSGMGPLITFFSGRQAVRPIDGRRGNVTGNAGPQNAATPNALKLLTFVIDGKGPLSA